MRYCRDVGRKLRLVRQAWEDFREKRVAMESPSSNAEREAGDLGG